MQFNFSYAPGLSLDQIKGFELAGKIWSTYLKDNVTLNIAVDLQKDFPGNAIAGSAPRLNTKGISPFRNGIEEDATSANDQLIAKSNNIMTGGSFSGRFDLYDASGKNLGVTQTSPQLNVNSANAKAIGLALPGDSNILDGYVVMRDLTGVGVGWNYDFARTGSAPSGTLDFLSVAIHEIGHILGFQSSVDRPGWVNPRTNGNKSAEDEYTKSLKGRANAATPLDLFRYSDKSTLNTDKKGVKPVDLAIGGNPYFSVKNGDSPIAYFDTGSDISLGGSGLQASHWKASGIMNAVINQASRPTISAADLNALDAIGYDLATQGASTPINYAQLLQQVTTKPTGDITDAVNTMLDNSSVYKKKDLTFWTSGARGGKWWQDFKQTFLEEGVFETLGNDDLEHNHGGSVDSLTGLTENEQIAGSLDSFSTQGFVGNSLNELVLGQLPSDLDLASFDFGSLAQTMFGNGAIASWLQQNSNNLVSLNLLENSTNGGNPIYDLGVNV